MFHKKFYIFYFFLLSIADLHHSWLFIDASSSSTSSSIPRSTHRSQHTLDGNSNNQNYKFPPWNPSPNIDENGFIRRQYQRIRGEWEKEVKLKNLNW